MLNSLQRFLDIPALYDLLQNLMGAKKSRRHLVQEVIRPFPGMRLLDIGCGTAEILDYLPHDMQYVGFDLSSRYILGARRRYGERAIFHCQSVTSALIHELESFDVVLASGVLHHLNDLEAESLTQLASSALKSGGTLITIDGCYVPEQNPIARFLLSIDRGKFVRDTQGYTAILNKSFASIDSQVRHSTYIPYTTFWASSKKA